MLRIILSLLLFLLAFSGNAQTHSFTKQWDKTYGGTNDDAITCFQTTADGGYIMGGISYSGMSGNKTQPNWDTTLQTDDFWVVKIDSLGNKQWDKRYGGTNDEQLFAVQQTIDRGYILAGNTSSDSGGDVSQRIKSGIDFWMVKINATGTKQWDKRFGGVYTSSSSASAVQQTADGGYIIGGISNSPIGGDKSQDNWDQSYGTSDYWIVKTDSLGNKQWDRRYGGNWYEYLYAVQQTNDGGYILGGMSRSNGNGDKSQNDWDISRFTNDYWVVRIDSVGNKLWDSTYGGDSEDELYTILKEPNGSFILAGNSYSGINGNKTIAKVDFWLLEIDSTGKQLRESAFEGGADFINMNMANDGGYLLTGKSYTGSLDMSDKSEVNLGNWQTWVLKIDSNWNKEWDKTIFSAGEDEFGYAVQNKNGCYAVANASNPNIGGYKTQNNWDITGSTYDFWIVAFTDTGLATGIPLITSTGAQITISPNPFTTDIAIGIQKDDLKQADFTIINLLGQPVYTKTETNLSPTYTKMLDLSYLPNGIYFVQVMVDGERVVRQIVKE